jgi:glycosyltransferase involved in cell wall biosynthesis
VDTLLEAVALLCAQGVDARAVVIGSGEASEPLKAVARRLGVPAVFPGRIPFSDVPAALASMNCCPFPRRDAPVTRLVPPLKLPEAMACGVPVVVADLPALTESIDHGRTGVVFGQGAEALAAALRDLHDTPAKARSLGEAGAAWAAQRCGWQTTTAGLIALWRELGVQTPE